MKVLITGGWGFLGTQLTKLLLERRKIRNRNNELVPITEIVLFDSVEPEDKEGSLLTATTSNSNIVVKSHIGDISDTNCCSQLLADDDGGSNNDNGDGDNGIEMCIFHLAGVMSGACEQDFDLAWRVNVLGTANLLQACRKRKRVCRIVCASTIAVFGEQPAESQNVSDNSKLRPTNTYGMTKATCELLINDMTRRGFIDGRVARLPTVIVRPGLPNAASTSCFSGIVREPLAGIDITIPVRKDLNHTIIGLRCCVQNILNMHEISLERMEMLCGSDRAVNLPSLSVTLCEIEAAMKDVAIKNGISNLGKIDYHVDEFITGIVASMASATDFSRATALGLEKNPALVEIVSEYIDDFGVTGSGLYKKK